jgi:hypothetical protein
MSPATLNVSGQVRKSVALGAFALTGDFIQTADRSLVGGHHSICVCCLAFLATADLPPTGKCTRLSARPR